MNTNDMSARRLSELEGLAANSTADPMAEIRHFAGAAAELLAVNFEGLRIESDESLLNNLEAFGYLFGLLEQSQRFFALRSKSVLAEELVRRVLEMIVADPDRASALLTYVEFQRKNIDFVEGYVNGMRAAVRMARA